MQDDTKPKAEDSKVKAESPKLDGAPPVVEPTPSSEPKVKVTEVPKHMQSESRRGDETVPGGMTVQRINNGKHFQVQDAEGRPIPVGCFTPDTS